MKRIFRLKTFVNNGLQIQGQEKESSKTNRFDFSFITDRKCFGFVKNEGSDCYLSSEI